LAPELVWFFMRILRLFFDLILTLLLTYVLADYLALKKECELLKKERQKAVEISNKLAQELLKKNPKKLFELIRP